MGKKRFLKKKVGKKNAGKKVNKSAKKTAKKIPKKKIDKKDLKNNNIKLKNKSNIKLNSPVKKSNGKMTIRNKEISIPVVNKEDKKNMLNLFSDAYARQIMISLGGENALEIIRYYPCEVSDEEMARRLKVKISDIRSTLNKMHGEGFVEYTRRKDSETGWYSYSWSLNKRNIVGWSDRINKQKKDLFESELEKYYCKKCGLDSLVEFVDAMSREFKCSCCNGQLEFLEKDKIDQIFGKEIPEQFKRRRMF